MIINNINGFNIEVDSEVIDTLKWLDCDVVEILEEVDRGELERGSIIEALVDSSSDIYYYYEADKIIDEAETYEEINWACKSWGIEFEGDFEQFKFEIAVALLNDWRYEEASELVDSIIITFN